MNSCRSLSGWNPTPVAVAKTLDVVNGLAFILLLSSLLTPQITLQGLPHPFTHTGACAHTRTRNTSTMALAYRILFSGSICASVFQITEIKAEVTCLPVRGFPRGRTRQRDLLTHAWQHLPLFPSAALVGVTQTEFLPGKAF